MRPLDDSKRDNIIAAVYKIAAAKGLSAISMNEISKYTKLGVGTIYTYFTSKEEVLKEAFKRAETKALSKLYVDFDIESGYQTCIKNIFIKAVCYRLRNYEEMMFFDLYVQSDYGRLSESDKNRQALFTSDNKDALFRLLLKGVEDKIFVNTEIDILSTYIYGCIHGLTLGIVQKAISLKKESFDVYFRMLWSGLTRPEVV